MIEPKEDINLAQMAANGDSAIKKDVEFEKTAREQRPDPPVRGESILEYIDRWFHRLDLFIERRFPHSLNPFAHSGAIANTTFVIALVSGFVLLLWYKPSVYQAYGSLENMGWAGQFFRALHRYSSDACMLFIMYHGLKMFFARRFGGARWLAWVTGIAAVALFWFDGWLGYWLVWDERANQIAVGTAKMLDQLPIFAEPLTRSFLTNDSFNSLLFFLVFFIHMLIPLAIGIALWMHVSRMNKSDIMTNLPLTGAVVGSLAVLSAFMPADLANPARMLEVQQSMPIDYFYMLPVYFTDRLQGGMLWFMSLTGFIGFMSVPRLLVKKRPPKPQVDADKCNGCEQCYKDCPFNAITMLPRMEENKKKGDFYASIDPSKCVACGICVGSCDPVGIDFPRLPAMDVRRQVDEWLDRCMEEESPVYVAYVCANSAGEDLHIDEETGLCKELPGYIVRSIPCSGWVHPLMIERALRKGAEGVLVVGCQSEPDYRLGAMWTEKRIEGERHPNIREDKVDESRIHYLQYDRTDYKGFINAAREIQYSNSPKVDNQNGESSKISKYAVGAICILILATVTYFFSTAPYQVPVQDEAELAVAFTLSGRLIDDKPNNAASQEKLLPHMRGKNVTENRARSEVRLRIDIDGEKVLDKRYEPKGLYKDGNSGGLEYLTVEPGEHSIEIYLGDTAEEKWRYMERKEVTFEERHRRVIKFNRSEGFRWYPEDN